MAHPDIIAGDDFDLYHKGPLGTETTLTFIATATSLQRSLSAEMEESFERDKADPTKAATKRRVQKGQDETLSFSGRCELPEWLILETIFRNQATTRGEYFQIQIGFKAGTGKKLDGKLMFTALTMGKSDGGQVTFTAEAVWSGGLPVMTAET